MACHHTAHLSLSINKEEYYKSLVAQSKHPYCNYQQCIWTEQKTGTTFIHVELYTYTPPWLTRIIFKKFLESTIKNCQDKISVIKYSTNGVWGPPEGHLRTGKKGGMPNADVCH